MLQSKARRAAPLRRVARTDPPTTSTPTRPPSSPHPPTRVLGHALQDHLILHHQLTRGAHTQRLQAEGGGGDRQVGDEGWGGTRVRVHAGCVWAGERTRRRGAQVSAGWWPGSLTPPSLPVAARLGDVLRGVHARQHAQGEAGGLAAAVVRLGGGGGVRGWVGGWVVGRGEEGRDGTRACAHTLSWACCQGRWPLRLLSSPPPPVAAPSRPFNPPPPLPVPCLRDDAAVGRGEDHGQRLGLHERVGWGVGGGTRFAPPFLQRCRPPARCHACSAPPTHHHPATHMRMRAPGCVMGAQTSSLCTGPAAALGSDPAPQTTWLQVPRGVGWVGRGGRERGGGSSSRARPISRGQHTPPPPPPPPPPPRGGPPTPPPPPPLPPQHSPEVYMVSPAVTVCSSDPSSCRGARPPMPRSGSSAGGGPSPT